MVYATDLDHTLLYSHKQIIGHEKDFVCVEYLSQKPITYMTISAIQKLKSLMEKLVVIPVTTRSIQQFKRILPFSASQYAIVDNGGTILCDGLVLDIWENYIYSILQSYCFEEVIELFLKLPALTRKPEIIDQKFIFAKSSNISACEEFLRGKLNTKNWQLSIQGQKIYAIPAEISKGTALKFVCEELLHENFIVASGDSNLDLPMLTLSSCGIIPSDCALASLGLPTLTQIGSGLSSSDSILDYVTTLATTRKTIEAFETIGTVPNVS